MYFGILNFVLVTCDLTKFTGYWINISTSCSKFNLHFQQDVKIFSTGHIHVFISNFPFPFMVLLAWISTLCYQCISTSPSFPHPPLKGRSRQLRPKAHILDDPLGNPYDVLKVLLGPRYGPLCPTKVPYCPLLLPKK